MTDWIVIPFRGPEGAKSRLAEALSDDERRELTLTMFQRVLAAGIASANSLTLEGVGMPVAKVLVVTPSTTAAMLAEKSGTRVLMETTGSLNAALEFARERLRSEGAGSMTVIAADLPDIAPADIADLVQARGKGVAIAPDHAGRGTNGLSLPLAPPFPFAFGPDSLTAHTVAAQRLALPVTIVTRPGLARDIDVPADLGPQRDEPHA